MVKKRILFLEIVVLLVMACGVPGSSPDTAAPVLDVVAIQKEAAEAYLGYLASLNEGRTADAASFAADDERFRWFEDGQLRYSSAAEVRTALEGIGQFGTMTVEAGDLVVSVLGPDAVWLSTVTSTTVETPGEGGFSFNAAVTLVMIRTSSGWKLLSGHSSTPRQERE